MIQRIQSLFLLVVFLLMGILLLRPIALMTDGEQVYSFYSYGIEDANFQALPLLLLNIIIMAISATTIFLFKNRKLQMRLCVYNILLLAGYVGLTYFFYHTGTKFLEQNTSAEIVRNFTLFAINPLVAIVLTYLAFRNILKDDILVKSADRIR